VQEAVAEKDQELEQEREEHATQQEFDAAAIETLTSENKELKTRAGRDWKILDSLPPAKRGRFNSVLTNEKAMLAALKASNEIDKHYRQQTRLFRDELHGMTGDSKTRITTMMHQGHLRPQQVNDCIDSAGPDAGPLIRMPVTTADLRDNSTKMDTTLQSTAHLAMLRLLKLQGATQEQIQSVKQEVIQPDWNKLANKNTTTCLLSAYDYDSGVLTDRGRHIEAAKFFIGNYKADPTAWPIIKEMLPHYDPIRGNVGVIARTHKKYLESCTAYEPLRSYYTEHRLNKACQLKTQKGKGKNTWQLILELCEAYALEDMPDSMRYILRIFKMPPNQRL